MEPHDQPSDVESEGGNVYIDGPDGIAYAMTPVAAAETSDRLLHAANHAAGERLQRRDLDRRQQGLHPERDIAWTETDDGRLRSMLAAGFPIPAIAKALGRTIVDTTTRAHRF